MAMQEVKGPVVQITDGCGNLLQGASVRLLAAMFYPDDPEERELWMQTLDARVVADISKIESVPRKLLATVHQRIGQSETMLERAANRATAGVIAAIFF